MFLKLVNTFKGLSLDDKVRVANWMLDNGIVNGYTNRRLYAMAELNGMMADREPIDLVGLGRPGNFDAAHPYFTVDADGRLRSLTANQANARLDDRFDKFVWGKVRDAHERLRAQAEREAWATIRDQLGGLPDASMSAALEADDGEKI